MNKHRMDNIWQIMNEYDLETVDNMVHKLECDLCSHLLIDPRIAPCGCRFCKICIYNYLGDENKYCPGNTNECEEELLSIEDNVNIDLVTNKKIFKLVVKCPIEGCKYKSRIDKIEEHLTICIQQAIKCPYSYVGCKFTTLNGHSIDLHCEDQKDEHMKMLALELEKAKEENKYLKNENKLINDNLNEKQIYIDKLEQEKIETNFKEKHNQTISELKEKIESLNEKIEDKSNEIIELEESAIIYSKKINFCNSYLTNYFKYDKKEFIWKIDNFQYNFSNKNTLTSDIYYPYDKNPFNIQLILKKINENNIINYQLYISITNREYLDNDLCTFDYNITYGLICEKSGLYRKNMIFETDELCFDVPPLDFSISDIPVSQSNTGVAVIKLIIRLLVRP